MSTGDVFSVCVCVCVEVSGIGGCVYGGLERQREREKIKKIGKEL